MSLFQILGIIFIHSLSFFFLLRSTPCGILVPCPGNEPEPHALEPTSLNHWAARKVSNITFKTEISKPFAICNTDLSSELFEKGKSANCDSNQWHGSVDIVEKLQLLVHWQDFVFCYRGFLDVRWKGLRPVLCGGSHCKRTTGEAACAICWQVTYRWCMGIFYL